MGAVHNSMLATGRRRLAVTDDRRRLIGLLRLKPAAPGSVPIVTSAPAHSNDTRHPVEVARDDRNTDRKLFVTAWTAAEPSSRLECTRAEMKSDRAGSSWVSPYRDYRLGPICRADA